MRDRPSPAARRQRLLHRHRTRPRPQWAATTGVDLSRLVLCQPEHGEQALQVASLLIGSGAVDVLVVDSIAALVPRAELAAEIGERLPGVQAHLLSQGLRQLCGPIARSGTAVVVTNQLRQRAGAPGTPVYTAGGRALGYYASVRLDLRRLQVVKEGGRVVGSRLRVLVAKNKLGPAGQSAELEVRDDRGICEPTGRLEDPLGLPARPTSTLVALPGKGKGKGTNTGRGPGHPGPLLARRSPTCTASIQAEGRWPRSDRTNDAP